MKTRLLPLALLALASAARAQVDPNRVVATINGDDVKGSEYYRRMEFLPGVGRMQGNRLAEFPPGFLTLEQIITERLVFQLAKEKGVVPTDLEVQAELKNRMDEAPKLLENWRAAGRTDPELNYQIRFELAQFKLRTYGVTITDQQIEQQFNANPKQYTLPKRVKLRVIVVDTDEDKRAVDADLAAGKPFIDVAKSRSTDVTKGVGGDFGTLPVTVFQPTMRSAIDAVSPGQVTQWISGGDNNSPRSIRFLVEQVIPEQKLTLDAKLKRQIRQEMLLQRGAVKNNIETEMKAMRAKAKVEIRQPEFASAYKAFIDAYLKQGGG